MTVSSVQSLLSKVQRPESRVYSPASSVQSPTSIVQRPQSNAQSPASSTCVPIYDINTTHTFQWISEFLYIDFRSNITAVEVWALYMYVYGYLYI